MIQKFYKFSILNKKLGLAFCFAILLVSCTKYTGNSTTSSSGSSGNPSPSPLPGSGGSSGSGGSTSIPQAYIQNLNFSNYAYAYVTYNDSISLKKDGSYTVVYAGNGLVKSKVGTGASSDLVYTTASYYFRPYSYYTYVLFTTPSSPIGEVLLTNNMSTVSGGAAQVRFLSLDPLTTTTPITFKVTNYLDNIVVANRKYLDNKTDTLNNKFQNVTPGISVISFVYKDSTLLTFNRTFESGKKYTVFAGALSYVTSVKGTLPINYYQVAQHN